jgi:hypothetical protein
MPNHQSELTHISPTWLGETSGELLHIQSTIHIHSFAFASASEVIMIPTFPLAISAIKHPHV